MAGTRHTSKAGRKQSCTRKKPLKTRHQADRWRLHRISQGAPEWSVNVYSCRFCGLFHVGHRSDPRGIHRRTGR
jgi:hypothetical protein